jgi:DNA invertase Pin-like site-specific DNA recombinase
MRRALIAARVSTRGKGQDPETQVRALQETAQRMGWEVVKVLCEHGSAWEGKKATEWEKRVFEALEASSADVLMVWSLDRFTRRRVGEALALVERLENHYGVQLYSLQEPFLSTATADPRMRDVLLSFIAWAGERESSRRSERLLAKAAARRAQAGDRRGRWGRGSMPTEADKRRIHWLASPVGGGLSQRAIAAQVGLSLGTVNKVLRSNPPPETQPLAPEGSLDRSSGYGRTGGES